MHRLEIILRNMMDIELMDYVNSDPYITEQDEIIRLIKILKSDLPEDKIKTFNELLDKLNVSDSEFAYKAFIEGVISGMKIMEAIMK